MSDAQSRLSANLAQVRARIDRAAARAGRDPGAVKLVAVSKGRSADAVRDLMAAGVRDFGENRVQELVVKAQALRAEGLDATWHMIGTLQTNKVKALLAVCRMVHSLDRSSLAVELDRRMGDSGLQAADGPLRALLEVNVSGETTKSGLAPAGVAEFLRDVAGFPGLVVVGLMTMAPASPDSEASRLYFRRLRQLAEKLNDLRLPRVHLTELSMGMSQDYEVAVEEGATIVRVGTALFGPRP